MAQGFKPVGERFEDVDIAIHLGREDLSVGHGGRPASDRSEIDLIKPGARGRVESVEVPRVVGDIHAVPVHKRRRKSRGDGVRVPLPAGGRDVPFERTVNRDHLSHETAFERLIALIGVDNAVADGDRSVERSGRKTIVPRKFAGARAKGIDPTVGAAADQQTLAADDAHDGVRLVVEILDRGG